VSDIIFLMKSPMRVLLLRMKSSRVPPDRYSVTRYIKFYVS
jgi:hypothetical protein